MSKFTTSNTLATQSLLEMEASHAPGNMAICQFAFLTLLTNIQ
jgi:hypothetical protein